jgi:hypothetical protein
VLPSIKRRRCNISGLKRAITLSIWMDGSNVWLKSRPADSRQQRSIIQLPRAVFERFQSGDTLHEEEIISVPSGPENDPTAFLRIGRIKPPLAITVTLEGLVKRWNLETDTATATVELGTLPGAVGQLFRQIFRLARP